MRGTVALALSGGVARCIAQIGVLQQLQSAGVPIDAIAGTSGGSLIGAFYAVTRDPARMAAVARTIRWRSIVRPAFSRRSLFDGGGVARLCARIIGPVTFDQLSLPFVAVATDLRSGARVVLNRGAVATAVQASCSLPVLFPPVECEGRLLVDGGASSQLPVLAAKEMLGAKIVIGVDVNANAAGSSRLDHMGQIGAQFVALFAMANAMRERPYADVMIDVDATGVSLYDLSKAELLLERGRRATEAKLGEIEAAVRRSSG